MKQHGFCAKCHNMRFLQGHHVYAKRFFGKKNNDCKLLICDECHEEIESILPKLTKLTEEEYRDIHGSWLLGKTPTINLP